MFTEHDFFLKLEQRAQELNLVFDVDFSIRNIIRTLNSIPGVATVWSCSGVRSDHEDDVRFNEHGYVSIAVDEDNYSGFLSLVNHVLSHGLQFSVYRLLKGSIIESSVQSTPVKEKYDNSNSYICFSLDWYGENGMDVYRDVITSFTHGSGQ